jgi:3-oxoacyl-[acyl-carrier protein] reductase
VDLELKGKVVMVTGSNRGTGLVIARAFEQEGAQVIVHSMAEQQRSEEWSDQVIAVSGDITTDEGAQAVLNQVNSHCDALDVLVNNYGTGQAGTWNSASSNDWVEVYQKNTLSVLRMVQAFSPAMAARKNGRIVNLGTIGSTRPNRQMPHYYASKGALANMTVSLAKELSGTGVTVNLVSPGLIRTPEVESGFLKRAQQAGWGNTFDEAESEIAAAFFPNPLNRIATREEIADVVVFLASRRASFINGQNIRVDGGAVDIV